MSTTVPKSFAAAVKKFSDRIATVDESGASLTYTQFDAQRIEAACALIALGVQPGDRVAIWAQNCVEWMIAGLAIHSVGAVLVPVNTRMRGQEAAYVLQKSGARVLFCPGNFLDTHYPTLLAPHRPASLETIVVLRDAKAGDISWSDFMARATGVSADEVHRRAAAVKPDDRMDIMFTSGTTGLPKGVITHHGQNLKAIAQFSKQLAFEPADQYLVVNPFFHVFGYKVGWLGGLLAGLTVRPHAIFDAKAVMRRIASEKISLLPGPPTLFISLLNDPDRSQYDLSSLRATITGAAAVAPSLIERMRTELDFDILITGYGLTESCGIVSLGDPSDSAETVATTCGKPIPDTEVRCIDPDGKPVATGETGEVVVRGYTVMQGYLDDPEETRETIDSDGWLHTGDIGLLDKRGYLRITDRLKDMYIAGGFNCYPAEIERIMAAHPSIMQVSVIGVPDERLGEVGKAYVVPRPSMQVDTKELVSWCREQMANYKVPRYIEVVASVPTNPSGKVLKYQLRDAVKNKGAA